MNHIEFLSESKRQYNDGDLREARALLIRLARAMLNAPHFGCVATERIVTKPTGSQRVIHPAGRATLEAILETNLFQNPDGSDLHPAELSRRWESAFSDTEHVIRQRHLETAEVSMPDFF